MDLVASLRGVTRSFGSGETRARVLGPIDVDVRAGEVTLVTGPSGSGKTTLLSILGLLLAPTEGRIRLGGEDVSDASEARRTKLRRERVAFVFQQFNLVEALTAAENVQVALSFAGLRARREDAMALLERLGIAGKSDHLPRELSGGQKQRVGIARALAMPGRLVLADEPTAALDRSAGRSVMGALADLAEAEDRAVVVVTHDTRWSRLAGRRIEIEDGRIVRRKERARA